MGGYPGAWIRGLSGRLRASISGEAIPWRALRVRFHQPGNSSSAPGGERPVPIWVRAQIWAKREPIPRIVPNPLDNSLLIQSSATQYQSILKLMDQLDIPPRQILLEAKIYEVSLTGAFASGVTAVLQKIGAGTATLNTHQLQASTGRGRNTADRRYGSGREPGTAGIPQSTGEFDESPGAQRAEPHRH